MNSQNSTTSPLLYENNVRNTRRILSQLKNIPIYGKCQGSGSSLVFWSIISNWLFDANKNYSKGAILSTPKDKTTIKYSIFCH